MSGAPPGVVAVTGASGFIGGRLAARLAGEGRAVRCLARASSDVSALEALGLPIARADLGDARALERALDGAAAVVHCAALVSDWATTAEIEAANVAGTVNVLRAARAAGVARLVHLSTTDVLAHPGGRAVPESGPPGRCVDLYGRTKLAAERAVLAAEGPERVVLRPATVYGPGSVEVVGEIARAIRGRHMLLIGGGRAIAGLCYVENLLDAIVRALDLASPPPGPFNVADGLDVTWRRFTSDLADGLGAPRPRLSIPYRPAVVLAWTLESGYRLLRRASGVRTPALLSRQAVHVLGRDQDFSNRAAREQLGWEPRVSYQQGLAATLAWLQDRSEPRPGAAPPAPGE